MQHLRIIAIIILFCSSHTLQANSTQRILTALRNAYPEKIGEIRFYKGDWSISINGKILFWAEGRLLPAEEKTQIDFFSPHMFRPHPKEVPPIRKLNNEERMRIESIIQRRETRKDSRHPAFLDALWEMENLETAEKKVLSIQFLGKKTRVHPDIVPALNAVEYTILNAAKTNGTIAKWVESIASTDAYVWRTIAGSANRSLHSYGIAIDLVPKDYDGKQVYWRWALAQKYTQWWAIPHSQRYSPPAAVIRAFEEQGFIWGGKWFLFDQIHFEYRPELILLRE